MSHCARSSWCARQSVINIVRTNNCTFFPWMTKYLGLGLVTSYTPYRRCMEKISTISNFPLFGVTWFKSTSFIDYRYQKFSKYCGFWNIDCNIKSLIFPFLGFSKIYEYLSLMLQDFARGNWLILTNICIYIHSSCIIMHSYVFLNWNNKMRPTLSLNFVWYDTNSTFRAKIHLWSNHGNNELAVFRPCNPQNPLQMS